MFPNWFKEKYSVELSDKREESIDRYWIELSDVKRLLLDIGLPKGFKSNICKCGNTYGYVGLDIGLCVKCIDDMGDEDEYSNNR